MKYLILLFIVSSYIIFGQNKTNILYLTLNDAKKKAFYNILLMKKLVNVSREGYQVAKANYETASHLNDNLCYDFWYGACCAWAGGGSRIQVADGTGSNRRIGYFYFVDSVYCSRSEEHTSELQSLRHLVCRL